MRQSAKLGHGHFSLSPQLFQIQKAKSPCNEVKNKVNHFV